MMYTHTHTHDIHTCMIHTHTQTHTHTHTHTHTWQIGRRTMVIDMHSLDNTVSVVATFAEHFNIDLTKNLHLSSQSVSRLI